LPRLSLRAAQTSRFRKEFNMLEFFNFARKRRLSHDQLQIVQMVAQQVVLSLEGSVRIPGAAKKAMALKVAGELLEERGIVAPDSLIDVSIETAVKLLKALDVRTLPPEPRAELNSPRVDASGRPPTGNTSQERSK
jgi:hypothetical protein